VEFQGPNSSSPPLGLEEELLCHFITRWDAAITFPELMWWIAQEWRAVALKLSAF